VSTDFGGQDDVSTQHPAGWYPDPSASGAGRERFWDGSQWTEQSRSVGEGAQVQQMQPHAEPLSATNSPRKPWWRRTGAIAAAAAVAGIILGSAIAGGAEAPEPADPTESDEYKALSTELDQTQAQLDDAQAQLHDAQSQLGDLPAAKEKLKEGRAALKDRTAQVAAREAAVKRATAAVRARERKVGIVERQVAANTIPGEGIFKVGTDMKPGTYRSAGKRGCYYAVLNSPDTFDIATNNNVDGPAFVSVSLGQYFQTQGCADWVLQP
jgi:hypothetical protein